MDFNVIGIHHIELTVSNLKNSRRFYEKLPGFTIAAQYPNFIMFYTGSFYLGLTDHKGKQQDKRFSERNVGMDHVSFEVSTKKDLDNALQFFDREKVSHGEIKKLSNSLYVLAFRDPDNIQLELTSKDR